MARIAYGGFMHETNCFVSHATTYTDFAAPGSKPPLLRGNDISKVLGGSTFTTSGMLELLEGKHELVPLIWCSGPVGGIVTREAFERISAEFISALSAVVPIDLLAIEFHGAMVSEDFEDAEGEVLRRARAVLGPDVPIVITLDYHANVTPEMVEYTDALLPYRTYPHVDKAETGRRAAKAIGSIIERGRPQGRAYRSSDFLIPLNAQCTMVDPSKAIIEKAISLENKDTLNVSYLAGFPPSDLYWCGPTVTVHAYTQQAADAAADALAKDIARRENTFAVPLLTPEQGVREAMRIAQKASRPVIIADTQDNPGAGGTSDTTGILEVLVRENAQGVALGYFWDAEAAAAAHNAGEGAEIDIKLGGKYGPEGVKPFAGRFQVTKLGNGEVRTTGPNVGGRNLSLGPCALLTLGGVSIAVTTKRMQAHDQAPFHHLGIEPKDQKILVLKSTAHFRAHFQPIAETVLMVIAPGGHLADSRLFDYRKLRAGVKLEPLGEKFAGPKRAYAR